jgi:hypothetical protein
MSRKAFAIWFCIFTVMQWFMTTPLVGIHSIIELLFGVVIIAIILSSFLGIAYVGTVLYEKIPQIWLYIFDNPQWVAQHSHGIGTSDFSLDGIFWLGDVLPLFLSLIVILHLFLCAKRCKYLGISVWWVLVPLYNPFVLLFRESNSVLGESINNEK